METNEALELEEVVEPVNEVVVEAVDNSKKGHLVALVVGMATPIVIGFVYKHVVKPGFAKVKKSFGKKSKEESFVADSTEEIIEDVETDDFDEQ